MSDFEEKKNITNEESNNFFINSVDHNDDSDNQSGRENPDDRSYSPKKKIILFSIIGACVILLGVGIFFLFSFLLNKKDPDALVKEAIKNAGPSFNYIKEIDDYSGLTDLAGKILTTDHEVNFDYSISNLKGSALPESAYVIKGAGIKGTTYASLSDHKLATQASITYGGIEFSDLSIFIEDEYLGLSVPMFYSGTVHVNPVKLGEDFNNSYFASFVNPDAATGDALDSEDNSNSSAVDENLSCDIYSFYDKYVQKLLDKADSMAKTSDDLFPYLTFTQGERGTITVNGQEVSCIAYPATLNESYTAELVSSIYDDLGPIELENGVSIGKAAVIDMFNGSPIEIICYLDSNDELVHVEIPINVTYEEKQYELSIEFDLYGQEKKADSVSGKISMGFAGLTNSIKFNYSLNRDDTLLQMDGAISANGEAIKAEFKTDFDTASGKLSTMLDLTVPGCDNISFSESATLSTVNKTEDLTVDFDSIRISSGDAFDVTLTGSTTFNTKFSSYPEKATPEIDLFNLSSEEFFNFIVDVMTHVADSPFAPYLNSMIEDGINAVLGN